MKAAPFNALQPDGMVESVVTFYAALYPELRQRAREFGYALPIHGSLGRDLDVVAIPWTEDAAPAEELVRALVEAAGGFATTRSSGSLMCGAKPHGRMAYTIHLGGGGGFVDLSVMPRVTPTTPWDQLEPDFLASEPPAPDPRWPKPVIPDGPG